MSFNPFSLTGKRILVTGASSGIGRAVAVMCSNMGADIIMMARDLKRLSETYNDLLPGSHSFFSIDLTKYESIEPIIEECVNKHGKFDGLVHSAGIEISVPLQFMKPQQYEEILSINVISGFELAKVMSKKKYFNSNGGSFVYLSSIRGIIGQEAAIAYSCSKGAIIAGVKSMALELAPKKIRVNSISPAIIETEMTSRLFDNISEKSKENMFANHPLGFGKPNDIAYACIYLLSDASRWITGSNMIVDGGYTAK